MAKKQTIECVMTLGERRGVHEIVKTYFFGVQPGGYEGSLFKLQPAFLKVNWTRGGEEDPVTQSRETEMSIIVLSDCLIKMACIVNAFGEQPARKNIYLKLGEKYPRIRLTGLRRFGRFVGNAEVNLELSRVTLDELKRDFNMEILSVGAVEDTKEVRQLIF